VEDMSRSPRESTTKRETERKQTEASVSFDLLASVPHLERHAPPRPIGFLSFLLHRAALANALTKNFVG
jgi:hypothetical protein